MEFPLQVQYDADVPGGSGHVISLYGGLTTLVGPNGSGKSQVLRALKSRLGRVGLGGRKVRLLSAGRLSPLENYRSNFAGGGIVNPEGLTLGDPNYRSRRYDTETVYGDFHALDERPDLLIKVAERLRCLFRREVFLEWDAGNLKVRFSDAATSSGPYSAAREASGLIHMVAILAALYDDGVGALLVDEPEVSLHPQLQSFILREMVKCAGDPDIPGRKLVVIATHSTDMLSVRRPSDLCSLAFCHHPAVSPAQVSPDAPELQGRKLQELLVRLGQEHKKAFFCARPILVEGASDAIICAGLDRHLDMYLDAAGAQVVPVMGKGQMPVVAKLMRLVGKSPILIADADALADGLDLVNSYADDEAARREAVEAGHASLPAMASNVHGAFCQLVERNWGDISARAEQHPYWRDRDAEHDETTRRRRSALASLLGMSEDERGALTNAGLWGDIHARITALLDALEVAGCFILRKGTIESYYSQNGEAGWRKPAAAAAEVDLFEELGQARLRQQYADPLRALTVAAAAPTISETGAIRDLLLSVAAPALSNLSDTTTAEELAGLARRTIGPKSSLLRLGVDDGNGGPRKLVIELNSSILEVPGFPLRLDRSCNLIERVDEALGRD